VNCCGAGVRFWHKADITTCSANVRAPYVTWIVVVLLLALPVLSPGSENPRPNPLAETDPDYSTTDRQLVENTTQIFLESTLRPWHFSISAQLRVLEGAKMFRDTDHKLSQKIPATRMVFQS
jgi:hypothetical protein